jgi:hypothetical protein
MVLNMKFFLATTSGNVKIVNYKDPLCMLNELQKLDSLDVIAKLAALVPKPRVNLTRFHIP